ncbi:hypothetical protein JCM10207_006957 [Rhodosporidiobolus poonsookiae]
MGVRLYQEPEEESNVRSPPTYTNDYMPAVQAQAALLNGGDRALFWELFPRVMNVGVWGSFTGDGKKAIFARAGTLAESFPAMSSNLSNRRHFDGGDFNLFYHYLTGQERTNHTRHHHSVHERRIHESQSRPQQEGPSQHTLRALGHRQQHYYGMRYAQGGLL